MRISDWSSDVCSSDLPPAFSRTLACVLLHFHRQAFADFLLPDRRTGDVYRLAFAVHGDSHRHVLDLELLDRFHPQFGEIGRASGRASVGQYVSISVVAVSLKQKTRQKNKHTHI